MYHYIQYIGWLKRNSFAYSCTLDLARALPVEKKSAKTHAMRQRIMYEIEYISIHPLQ